MCFVRSCRFTAAAPTSAVELVKRREHNNSQLRPQCARSSQAARAARSRLGRRLDPPGGAVQHSLARPHLSLGVWIPGAAGRRSEFELAATPNYASALRRASNRVPAERRPERPPNRTAVLRRPSPTVSPKETRTTPTTRKATARLWCSFWAESGAVDRVVMQGPGPWYAPQIGQNLSVC